MSIRDMVGAERYEAVRAALRAAFPDPNAEITDALVDAAFQLARHEWEAPELLELPIPTPTAPPDAELLEGPEPTGVSYYEGHATHARKAAPGSVFTGILPMVRSRLPERGTSQSIPDLVTAGGRVLPVDRLYASVDVLWSTYKSDPLLKFGRPERVEFLGPPRLDGARFGAISIYFCYAREHDPKPSFYLLEAGLATGQPRMPYLARTMDTTIHYQTMYQPTPFSEKWHHYTGQLAMRAKVPNDPSMLTVKVFRKEPPNDQYLEVTVVYERVQRPNMKNPFHLTIEAGARVQAIADALHAPSGLPEASVLRVIAKLAMSSLFSVAPKPQND